MTIEAMINGIRQHALDLGGSYIPYSQCLEPTKTLINSMPQTQGGICRALAAKWIAEHANGKSLWDFVFAPGTTNVQFAAIANLMINFIEGVSSSGKFQNPTVKNPDNVTGGNYQDLVMDKYLELYGVKRRSITKDLITGFQTRPPANAGSSIANRLSPKWLNGASYVHIYTGGGGSAHSTAAYVGTKDIAFFDPNFGEFYFEDRAKFVTFFNDFWQSSGYSASWGGFQLDPYGKAV